MKPFQISAFLGLSLTLCLAQTKVTRFVESPKVNKNGITKNAKAPIAHKISKEVLDKRKAAQKSDLFAGKYKPSTTKQKSKIYSSLYDNSDIITIGEYHTILPKNSILHFPSFLEGEISMGKGAGTSLLIWPRFSEKFSGLFEAVEIDQNLINGKSAFPAEKVKYELGKQKVLVAHYRGGPVTCLTEFSNPETNNQ